MKTSELLHFAFRAGDPLALGRWYAELFEGQFFIHPVMSALGIVIVKFNHPEAVFDGLLEFWPWDLEWDGQACVFRKIEARPTLTSYGHMALKVSADARTICDELERRGVAHRMEPRASGFLIPVVDDPDGNMIELFPNIDNVSLPGKALCPPEHIDAALAEVRVAFGQLTKNLNMNEGVPLLLFETQVQQQQQQGDEPNLRPLRQTQFACYTGRMPTILDKIVATKRGEIERAKVVLPERELRARLADAPLVRDFFSPLAAGAPIKLIAEVKKASPSAGVIRAEFDPVSIARTYEAHGASCISVLTDESYFQGRIGYLSQIRAGVGLPVLRKDFILDSYQVLEARVAGADAVLLIAECLDDCNLRKLFNETCELGMTPLVELYEPENLQRVFDAGATLIGVNNRDLHTFSVDLEHTIRMRDRVPDQCVLVGESGIKTHDDVQRLESAGVDAILVGESLMREPDIGAAVDRLLGH